MNIPGFTGGAALYLSKSHASHLRFTGGQIVRPETEKIYPSAKSYWRYYEGIGRSGNNHVRVRKVFQYCGQRFNGPHFTGLTRAGTIEAAKRAWGDRLKGSYLDRFDVTDPATGVNNRHWIKHFGGDMYCTDNDPSCGGDGIGQRCRIKATVCADAFAEVICPRNFILANFGWDVRRISNSQYKRMLDGKYGCHSDRPIDKTNRTKCGRGINRWAPFI